ncbi:MAG TPA: SufE family protein [Pirellulales bacterium]|jgi:cysteine desulfuration protein SufE|nr:SufE family protein [Pirellulales bacterium]
MDQGERVKLDDIVAEFADLEPRERLELLLEFAENLPPLPTKYEAERNEGLHRIAECQTPTFIWVELIEGRVQVHAYVAPEAPTVKGFVGILVDAFSGSTPEAVLSTPEDLLKRLGLLESLGMVRMRGLAAVQHYIRQQVAKAAANS